MGILCIIGLFQFFKSANEFNSFRAKIIIVNGLLYHGISLSKKKHAHYNYIYYYDILSNTIMTLYTIYYYPTGIIPSISTGCIFLFNSIIMLPPSVKYYFPPVVKDVIHVLFVQRMLSHNLYKSLH